MSDGVRPCPTDRRVGVVVPPANPVVEPEIRDLVVPVLEPFAARFPVHPCLDLEARLERYVDDTASTVATLAGLPVRATYLACTGSSYLRAADGDRAWVEAAATVTGAPVATAAGVVAELFRATCVERIRIVSPYPSWLTARCVEFWSAAGISIAGVHTVAAEETAGGRHPIYDLDGGALLAAAEQAIDAATSARGRADAVLVTGTGVPTIDAFDRLAPKAGVMLVSSNVAAARWLLISAGYQDAVGGSPHPSLAALGSGVVRR